MNCLRALFALFTGCLVLSGCNLIADSGEDPSGWHVEPGAIIFYGDTSAVELTADTVRVGASLRIGATTFGGGCTRKAGMRVEVHDFRAVLTPLDSVYTPGPNEACTDELKRISHRAEVVFARVGEAHVVVQGIGRGPDFGGVEKVQLERTVAVVE